MTNQADETAANDADGETSGTASRLHEATGAVRDAASAAKAAAGDTIATVREKVGDAIGTAREKSGAAYDAARERAGDAYDAAREKAADTYEAVRGKAGDAYGAARAKASDARRATADGIEDNPIVAIVGGIALGVLVGALLPRTKRETETLGPLASRLTDTAFAAVSAAREAGKEALDDIGVSREGARAKVDELVDTATKVASKAGIAATDAVRGG